MTSFKTTSFSSGTNQLWNFGSVLIPSESIINADVRAGWNAGVNSVVDAETILCAPVSAGSSVVLEVKFSATLGTATYINLQDNNTGLFLWPVVPYTLVTSDVTDVVYTSPPANVFTWQSANTWQIKFSTNGTGTITPTYAKITITHA